MKMYDLCTINWGICIYIYDYVYCIISCYINNYIIFMNVNVRCVVMDD